MRVYRLFRLYSGQLIMKIFAKSVSCLLTSLVVFVTGNKSASCDGFALLVACQLKLHHVRTLLLLILTDKIFIHSCRHFVFHNIVIVCEYNLWGASPSVLPFPPFPLPLEVVPHPPLPLPSLPPLPSLSLEVGPFNPARGSGERCKPPPQRNLGVPQPKSNFGTF